MLLGQIPTRPRIQHPTDPGRDRAFTRAVFFDMMKYTIHAPEVMAFHLSDARIRISSAPAQSSKSKSGAMEIIAEGMPTDPLTSNLSWVIGPDFKTNKEYQYIWEEVVEKDTFRARGVKISKAHNNPGNGDMLIVVEWGKNKDGDRCKWIVEGKSAQNPSSLQGEHTSMICLSEAAEHPEVIWKKYCSTRYTKVIMPTTPKPKADWIYEMVQDSETNPHSGIQHFQYPPGANPVYDFERFEMEKRRAESRTTSGNAEDDPYFAEQFLGLWGSYYTGQVIPFRKDRHIIENNRELIAGTKVFISCDYGYKDPAVALFWSIQPGGQLVIFDEIYRTLLTTGDFVSMIDEKVDENDVREFLAYITGDPRKPKVEHYLRLMELPVFTMNKNVQSDRALGHRRLVDLLSDDSITGKPKLYVMKKCVKTIHEWTHLRYRENITNEYGATALSGEDHSFDAGRYGVATMPEPDPRPPERDWLREHKAKVNRMAFDSNSRAASMGLSSRSPHYG